MGKVGTPTPRIGAAASMNPADRVSIPNEEGESGDTPGPGREASPPAPPYYTAELNELVGCSQPIALLHAHDIGKQAGSIGSGTKQLIGRMRLACCKTGDDVGGRPALRHQVRT